MDFCIWLADALVDTDYTRLQQLASILTENPGGNIWARAFVETRVAGSRRWPFTVR